MATCWIASADGSMLVSEVRGVLFVTWVSKANKDHAMRIPANQATKWLGIITQIAEMDCMIIQANDRPNTN